MKKIKYSKPKYSGNNPNPLLLDELLMWEENNKNSKSISLGKVFYLYYRKGFFWFRLFDGYGFWGRSQKRKLLYEMFSERYGYVKYLKIFGWKFKILKPSKL